MRKVDRSRGSDVAVGVSLAAATLAALIVAAPARAQPPRTMPEGFITGTVASDRGPEAGVWVIAQTTELKTPFIKIVVTDDGGRYVLPQLPEATYNVWVRGYGLVDSTPIEGRPGDTDLALTAKRAGTLRKPRRCIRATTGWRCSSRPLRTSSRARAVGQRHRAGAQGARSMDPQPQELVQFLPSARQRDHTHAGSHGSPEVDAARGRGSYRTQLGVRGGAMAGAFAVFGRENAMQVLSDWTNRVAAGEVPPAPPRPEGVERNVVVTLWDWGGATSFMHDEIATYKNDPTVNGYGPVYAVSAGHGRLTVLDPLDNSTYELTIPTREDPRKVSSRFPPPAMPSNFWGMQHLWGLENPADPHNPMMDRKGRVWMTSKIRDDQPAWCREGSRQQVRSLLSAQLQQPAGVALRPRDRQIHA